MSKLDQQLAELQRLRTEYDRLKAELPYDEQAHPSGRSRLRARLHHGLVVARGAR